MELIRQIPDTGCYFDVGQFVEMIRAVLGRLLAAVQKNNGAAAPMQATSPPQGSRLTNDTTTSQSMLQRRVSWSSRKHIWQTTSSSASTACEAIILESTMPLGELGWRPQEHM